MSSNSRTSVFVLLAPLIFGICACAPTKTVAQSELPSWVNNPSQQFNNDRYLMAVGSSTSRQAAKDNAQAQLAKIFVSKVKVNESYVQEYKEFSSSEGGTQTQERTNLITQSEVSSNQQMRNVQIKEVYPADDGTFYALAVMERAKTARLYTEEINNKKSAIKSLRKKAAQTDSKLERLIYLKQALNYARINDMLANQRAVLTGQTTQGKGAKVSDIKQAYRDAKQQCTLSLHAKDISREVRSAIARQVQNEGFTVVKGDEQPVVTMNVNLSIDPLDLDRPQAKFVHWALQVEAQNNETGQWFSTYTAEGKAGSLSQSRARKRAIKAVQEDLETNFSRFIYNELLSVQ